jgi:hypothetical protein
MASCAICGSFILAGGIVADGLRFCSDQCQQKHSFTAVMQHIPMDVLAREVVAVHRGHCPKCKGKGPVDVHMGYTVWSAVHLTCWKKVPHLCCRACGVKGQLSNAAFSFFLGWWGVLGIFITPLQVLRNFVSMARPPKPLRPSRQLQDLICVMVANQLATGQLSTGPD